MTEIPSPESLGTPEVSFDDVINYVRAKIDEWDFDDESRMYETRMFTLNIIHWLLESLGDRDNTGNFLLYTGMGAFTNELLPPSLRHLLARVWQGELFITDHGEVTITTDHVHFKDTPKERSLIDEYREQGLNFFEMVDHLKAHPELISRLRKPKETVMPQISLLFQTASFGWGLEFLINQNGIQVAPFGPPKSTWIPTSYALEQKNDGQLARTVCDLAVLGARHTWTHEYMARRPNPETQLLALDRRLSREDEIPLI